MKIKQIITQRATEKWPSFDLVYEWEDILSHELEVPMYNYRHNRYYRRLKDLFDAIYNPIFAFEMNVNTWRTKKEYYIPCIIDFTIAQHCLNDFYEKYAPCPIVLVSSREVYEFLKKLNCPLKLEHWALSLPDNYKIMDNTQFKKEYDLVLMGRQNPVLENYLQKYKEKHPKINYVHRIMKNGEFNYYTSNGEYIGNIRNRKEYIELMSKARIGLYATPGIDGGERLTSGFNPVTPRLLEYLACGCHIIARYPDNADTRFYELESICPSICTYSEFEERMEYALSAEVDMGQYAAYLSNHYTSVRARSLQQILNAI